MTKTMLTYKTLDRFESEYKTAGYTGAQLEEIERAAYVANMNRNAHEDWTDADVFADFLRVLAIHKIDVEPIQTAEEDEADEEPCPVRMSVDELTERITEAVNDLTDDKLIELHNRWCEAVGYYDDVVRPMCEFWDELQEMTPEQAFDAGQDAAGEKFSPNCDSWFWVDAYGYKSCSSAHGDRSPVCIPDIVRHMIEDEDALEVDEVQDALDEFQERNDAADEWEEEHFRAA